MTAEGPPTTSNTEETSLPLRLDWHQLLQVIYGVLLSAALGAFASSGPPGMLTSQLASDPVDRAWIWIVITVVAAIMMFDSWYQFSVHGRWIQITKPDDKQPRGKVVSCLMVAMFLSSFIPFQLLAKSISYEPAILRYQPVNRLFGASIALATAIQLVFIAVVAFKGENMDITQKPLAKGPRITLDLEKKALQHFGYRLGGLLLFLTAYVVLLSSGRDSLEATVSLSLVWFLSRLFEIALSVRSDRKAARSAVSTNELGGTHS